MSATSAASLDAATSGRPTADLRAIEASLVEIEALRKRLLKRAVWTGAVLLATLPLAIAPLLLMAWLGMEVPADSSIHATHAELHARLTPHLERIGIVVFAAPLVWLFCAIWFGRAFVWRAKYTYRAEYKERVLTAVCARHFPALRYEPAEGIPWRILDDSGLFPFASDVYSSDDRFSGRVGATEVCFGEAIAQQQKTRGWGKNRRTVYETYFRGTIFSADFNKHIGGTTRVLPRGERGTPGDGEQPARLEDPRFSGLFDTWTTDQVEARYLLSPSLMERLVELNGRFPGLRARFSAERLLLLLPDARDRFEASLLAPAASSAQLDGFVADVRLFLGVVTTLDLDTRIWSKA